MLWNFYNMIDNTMSHVKMVDILPMTLFFFVNENIIIMIQDWRKFITSSPFY